MDVALPRIRARGRDDAENAIPWQNAVSFSWQLHRRAREIMSATKRSITCLTCGVELAPRGGPGRKRLYCSERCRDRARRRREAADAARPNRVKTRLTSPERHENLDAGSGGLHLRDLLTADVSDGARQVMEEFEHDDSPGDAIVAARKLLAVAEAVLQAAVDRARTAGATWREVGQSLEISKQAAFQRFGRPSDPRGGASMTRAAAADARERSTAFVDDLTAGRWDAVLERFDAEMRVRHDANRLARGWFELIAMFGRFQSVGAFRPVLVGADVIVDVPLAFEAGEAMVWIRFDSGGKVAGLRLHPASS